MDTHHFSPAGFVLFFINSRDYQLCKIFYFQGNKEIKVENSILAKLTTGQPKKVIPNQIKPCQDVLNMRPSCVSIKPLKMPKRIFKRGTIIKILEVSSPLGGGKSTLIHYVDDVDRSPVRYSTPKKKDDNVSKSTTRRQVGRRSKNTEGVPVIDSNNEEELVIDEGASDCIEQPVLPKSTLKRTTKNVGRKSQTGKNTSKSHGVSTPSTNSNPAVLNHNLGNNHETSTNDIRLQETYEQVGLKSKRRGNTSSSSNPEVSVISESAANPSIFESAADPTISEHDTHLTKPVRVRIKKIKIPQRVFKTGVSIRVVNKQTVQLNAEALRNQFRRLMATNSQAQRKGKAKMGSKYRRILPKMPETCQSEIKYNDDDVLDHPQNLEENRSNPQPSVNNPQASDGVYLFTCLRCHTTYSTLKALKVHSVKHDSFNMDKDICATFTRNVPIIPDDTVRATDSPPLPIISSVNSENPVVTAARGFPSTPVIRCRTDLQSSPGRQLRTKPSPSVRYRDDFETVSNPSRSIFHHDDEDEVGTVILNSETLNVVHITSPDKSTDANSAAPSRRQLRVNPSPNKRYATIFETANANIANTILTGARDPSRQAKFATQNIPSSRQSFPVISLETSLNLGSQNTAGSSSSSQQHKCDVCNASFVLMSSLLVHKKRHEKNDRVGGRNNANPQRVRPMPDNSVHTPVLMDSRVTVKQEISGEEIDTAQDDPLMIPSLVPKIERV